MVSRALAVIGLLAAAMLLSAPPAAAVACGEVNYGAQGAFEDCGGAATSAVLVFLGVTVIGGVTYVVFDVMVGGRVVRRIRVPAEPDGEDLILHLDRIVSDEPPSGAGPPTGRRDRASTLEDFGNLVKPHSDVFQQSQQSTTGSVATPGPVVIGSPPTPALGPGNEVIAVLALGWLASHTARTIATAATAATSAVADYIGGWVRW